MSFTELVYPNLIINKGMDVGKLIKMKIKTRIHATKACEYCVKRHVRCENNPCKNCVEKGLQCERLPSKPRGPKKKRKSVDARMRIGNIIEVAKNVK